jgi:uncharacterized membrane protein
MIPFYVMLAAILLARLLGATAVPALATWEAATRAGLAVMFFFTAAAHFTRTRADLIRMVLPVLPRPDILVTLTGVLELAGATGLLVPATARGAAFGLIALLVAMLPANIHAARSGGTLRGKSVTPLAIRAPLQLLWIALLAWSIA